MTDQQLLTMALAVIVPLSMLLYSNSRISEAKETLRAEIGTLRAEMQLGFERISNQIRELRDAIHVHEIEHHQK